MTKQARIQRKKQRIKDHNDRVNGVYYKCNHCKKRFKVSICPECGRKLKGAYCKTTRTLTGCDNGDIDPYDL